MVQMVLTIVADDMDTAEELMQFLGSQGGLDVVDIEAEELESVKLH